MSKGSLMLFDEEYFSDKMFLFCAKYTYYFLMNGHLQLWVYLESYLTHQYLKTYGVTAGHAIIHHSFLWPFSYITILC